MAIYDLFLNNPRTRAARYAASQAESGALRQTSGVLGNRAVNPAAAAQALAQTSAAQRAASHGMVAQAQAADEAARAEGVQQLIGTGLSAFSSALPFMTGGAGQAVQGVAQGALGAAQGGLAGAQAPAVPSVAETAMRPAAALGPEGFGAAGAPFAGNAPSALTMGRAPAPPADPTKPSGPDVPQQGVTVFPPGEMPLVPKPPWQGYPQPAAGPQPLPEGAPVQPQGPVDPRPLAQQMPMSEAYRAIDDLVASPLAAPAQPSRPRPAAAPAQAPAPSPLATPAPAEQANLGAQPGMVDDPDLRMLRRWREADPQGFSLFANYGTSGGMPEQSDVPFFLRRFR